MRLQQWTHRPMAITNNAATSFYPLISRSLKIFLPIFFKKKGQRQERGMSFSQNYQPRVLCQRSHAQTHHLDTSRGLSFRTMFTIRLFKTIAFFLKNSALLSYWINSQIVMSLQDSLLCMWHHSALSHFLTLFNSESGLEPWILGRMSRPTIQSHFSPLLFAISLCIIKPVNYL